METDQLQVPSALGGLGSRLEEVSTMSQVPSADDEVPSSSSFNPSQDTSSILHRIIMTDYGNPTQTAAQPTSFIASAGVTDYGQSTSEDVFTTPPTTPPGHVEAEEDRLKTTTLLSDSLIHNANGITEPNSPAEFDDQYFVQEADAVKLPSISGSGGKKRPLADHLNPEKSRKMTRDIQGQRSWQTYDVRHSEPTIVEITGLIDQSSQKTASTATATTSRTTPNTSFYTESVATSFGPTFSDTESDRLAREQQLCNQKMLSTTHLYSGEEMMDIDINTSCQLKEPSYNDVSAINLPVSSSKVLPVRPPSTQNVSGHDRDYGAAPKLGEDTIDTRVHCLIPSVDPGGGQYLRQILEEQTPFGKMETSIIAL